MSGIEIAGLVLGAFPIALGILKQYEVVKTQVRLWRGIQEAYVECQDELIFQQLLFQDNLLDLFSMTMADDEKIKELISNPGGECWKDESLTGLLEQEHYELYRRCINAMNQIMEKLNHELRTGAQYVQQGLASSSGQGRLSIAKYQFWRANFSTGENARKRQILVEQLRAHNEKLERLLKMSKKKRERKATRHSEIDSTLCNFWITASRLSKALSNAWSCKCSNGQHSTRLLLQKRLENEPNFNVVFSKASSSSWEIRNTWIAEQQEPSLPQLLSPASAHIIPGVATHQPKHRHVNPSKSSMKSSMKSPTKNASTSILIQNSLSLVAPMANCAAEHKDVKAISNLCSSLDLEDKCYGYLREEEYRYYIYRVKAHNTNVFRLSTLDEMLRKLNRKERYLLALILASSFLQLHDTPWLSKPWTKSDITFMNEPEDPNRFLFSQPHIHHNPEVTADTPQGISDHQSIFRHSPVDFGILLLELCFGRTLEDRPKTASGDRFIEALDWQKEVDGETGSGYSNAVLWCLVGYRSRPEKWKEEMFQSVVKPLEMACQYLQ